ncbi:GAF domain-containing protein [Deinococcus sp. Marseille-Q6407]|uniref:GAF domain-containing protein n=1 Tax=Deinococcus sp. Marseille-Q6407 TaxID=2969223 RepID=UPI0021BE4DAE|nr:GAF domain-containing protein [Deinococcus sp. Marseille-Q6407]
MTELPSSLTVPATLPAELLTHTDTAAFAAALAEWACGWAGAHGVAVWVQTGGGLERLAESGHGLTLATGELVRRSPQPCEEGLLCALPFGVVPHAFGTLEVVAGRPGLAQEWPALAGTLGLALEATRSRELQAGRGRVAAAIDQLVRRTHGSLDHEQILTAVVEVAAQALGFQRAFAGLLAGRPGERGYAPLQEIWSTGFGNRPPGEIGVGPVTYAALLERGEVISYRAAQDAETPLGRSLASLAPQTALLAPLRVRGEPLGLLYADSDRDAPAPGDAALLLELAEQAGLALGSARRFAEATRGRQGESVLRELGLALAGSLRLSDTLAELLSRTAGLFGADAAALYTPGPGGRTLGVHSALNLPSEWVLRARVRPGSGLSGQAFATGMRAECRDFPASGLGGGSRYTRALLAAGEYPFRGVLALPLTTRRGPFGVLTLYYHAPLPLDDTDLKLADALSVQAALAIENALLYGEGQEREREAATLLDISQRLEAGLTRHDLERLLGTLLRGLLWLPGVGAAAHGMPLPAGAELVELAGQLGRGPRPLPRRWVQPGAGSALLAPLRHGQEVLGLLYADDPGLDLPPQATLRLAHRLCSHLADRLGRQQLAEALARSEAGYRQLAESSHDLILTADPQGRVLYANPAARRLLAGHPQAALAPQARLAEWVGGDEAGQERWTALWAQGQGLRAGQPPLRAEVTLAGRRLELQLGPLSGSPSLLVMGRDLSEHYRLLGQISQRGQELAAASARRDELRTFLALFTQAQEEERRRISRELHDETAQLLVAARRRVLRLEKQAPQAAADIQAVAGELSDIAAGVRRFARFLRPSVLDDLGLLPALEWLCTQARTPARLEVSGEELVLSPAQEVTLFRLVGEALANVDKHARANSAAVRITFGPGSLQTTVSDDGQGFDPAAAAALAAQGHLGLLGLRERAQLAGGRLELDSRPGGGTRIHIWLPV